MIALIIIILLVIIACSVAPEGMAALFTLIWALIKIAFVLAVIGGGVILVMQL